MAWVVLDGFIDLAADKETAGKVWLTLLWLTPLIRGALGILLFDKVLPATRSIFEDYLMR